MPSAFIVSQAELLKRSSDPFLVLQNLRDKYSISSFPSQMSRVKDLWFEYGVRHENYDHALQRGWRELKKQGLSSQYLDQYEQFGRDNMKEQLRKSKLAAHQKLTGSTRTDRIISNIPILPEYMADYKLSRDDSLKYNSLSSKCLEKRSMECVEIADADELVKKCHRIVKDPDSHDPFIVVAACSVLCGRRSIELLKTGEFSPSRINGYCCEFRGAAKKRGMCGEKTTEIPLLIKFKHLIRAIDNFRSRIDVNDLTNSRINAKYSHKLGDAAKILVDSLEVRFHDLRMLYGNITHQAFTNKCSINIWLKKVLMHDTIDTSIFYSRCKILKCTIDLGSFL